MEEYLYQYFDLLINTDDIEVIKEFLPGLTLDRTEELIDLLIENLEKEFQLAIELEDLVYKEHLMKVISLLQSKKEKVEETVSVFDKDNILIFGPNFLKDLKRLNDSKLYAEVSRAIESLMSKEWLKNNFDNPQKYRRLHGVASGLSEIKASNIRLLHMPISDDFWYVISPLKKEGNNKKGHQNELARLKIIGKDDVEKIRINFTKEGKIDYVGLSEYARSNNEEVMNELARWEVRKK